MASSRKNKPRGAKASRSSFRGAKAKQPAKQTRAKKQPAKKPAAAKRGATKRAKPAVARQRTPKVVGARTKLGDIVIPSGKLAMFDIGLFGYLPREALEPAIVTADVPANRRLSVIATPVGRGRFTDCWDHVSIVIGPGEAHTAKKLGEAGVDFARLVCIDHVALDQWVHEDSLDGLADFVFWGRDAPMLAKSMRATRLGDAYGWSDLTLAEAEAKADEAARRKAENKWLLSTDARPHSHHFQALAAARASPHGAGELELAGSRLLLFFTSWGDGVFPIYLDLDADDHPVQIRVQLATAASNAAMAAMNR